jgi:hypothetical protein
MGHAQEADQYNPTQSAAIYVETHEKSIHRDAARKRGRQGKTD